MKKNLISEASTAAPIGSMVMVYLPTFTININQMYANIPCMDSMGYHLRIATSIENVDPCEFCFNPWAGGSIFLDTFWWWIHLTRVDPFN